jgi:adenine specific DNA methylase Mod
VQTIYIDPPFNLDSSDQFLYRTNYKDANWATLLENRLKLAKDWLNKKGSIFVRCDYNGNWIVRCLMDNILGKENFRNEIIVNKSIRIKTKGNKFPTWHDSFYFYSMSGDNSFFKHITEERKEEEWRSIDTEGEAWEIVPENRLNLFSKENLKKDENENYITRARIVLGKEILPREGRRFPSQKVISELEKKKRIRLSENNNPQMLKPSEIYLTDNWSDIYGYASEWDFQTENSEIGINRCIESTSNKSDLVFDFFLGSGTTTAVAHKLGRKWLGVEMGEHFYTVVLPRMKKVLAYDKSGISKEVKEYQGGGFFKYYELEQYEEALANCKYEDGDLFNVPGRSPYLEYVFMKDEKMLKAVEIDYEKEKVKVDLTKLYPNIDIAETLSNLTGKWIKKITDR